MNRSFKIGLFSGLAIGFPISILAPLVLGSSRLGYLNSLDFLGYSAKFIGALSFSDSLSYWGCISAIVFPAAISGAFVSKLASGRLPCDYQKDPIYALISAIVSGVLIIGVMVLVTLMALET